MVANTAYGALVHAWGTSLVHYTSILEQYIIEEYTSTLEQYIIEEYLVD